MELADIHSQVKDYDVIAVDEGQFFKDIPEYCKKWADDGKIVIVAALDGTYERQPFGNICDLLPIAESVRKLTSVCLNCGEEASFTHKHQNRTGEINDMGGLEKYTPVCRSCYLEKNPSEIPDRKIDK